MKIVLVNPPYVAGITRHAPLGICYVAAVLEHNSFEVSIVDMESGGLTVQNTVDKIVSQHPMVVGFSCMTPQYPILLQVANALKEHDRNILTVFGGPHVSAMPYEAISNKQVDVCIRGEGEFAMLNLVRTLEKKDKPRTPGIIFKVAGIPKQTGPPKRILNLDRLPLPARHLLDMKHYIFPFFDSKIPTTNIVASRGCPYACTFCYKAIFGNRWRGRNPQSILNEIKGLQEKYSIEGIYFMDDNFCINKSWVKALCKKLRKLKQVVWATGGIRADLINRDILRDMKKSGCRWVGIGVESGDPQILQKINKKVTIKQIKNAFEICHKEGIFAHGFFMIGYPDETMQSFTKTIQLIKTIRPDDAYISIYTPYPGTKVFYEAMRKGWINKDFIWNRLDYTNSDFTISQNFTISELRSWREKMYSNLRRRGLYDTIDTQLHSDEKRR
jgi:magnesium-protoporphyrin IX monomethyl ester (oxidative) cyclase